MNSCEPFSSSIPHMIIVAPIARLPACCVYTCAKSAMRCDSTCTGMAYLGRIGGAGDRDGGDRGGDGGEKGERDGMTAGEEKETERSARERGANEVRCTLRKTTRHPTPQHTAHTLK